MKLIAMSAVALATALGTCAGAIPALAQSSVFPSLTLKLGAHLTPGVSTPLTSLFTLNRGSYLGAQVNIPWDSTITNFSVSGGEYKPLKYYAALLYGQNPSELPSWATENITANSTSALHISGAIYAYYACGSGCNDPTTLFIAPGNWSTTIPTATFKQVVNGADLVPIEDYSGPGTMGAQFNIPANFGLNVQQVANLGGYDHFNWLQTITGFSYNGVPESSIAPFGLSVLGRPTGLDPALGGNLGRRADSFAPYWNEVNCFLCGSDYYLMSGVNQTVFRDSPNLIQAGWSANFETQFIGVRSDGSYDVLTDTLDDPGLTFQWEYTQTSIFCLSGADCGVVASVLSNIDPSLAGNGVVTFLGFGESASSVPELSTWSMMFIGFAGLGFAGYRSSRRKHSEVI
jgi:hypothetical protein